SVLFTPPATTDIYTLSLHDALPISFSIAATAPQGTQNISVSNAGTSSDNSAAFEVTPAGTALPVNYHLTSASDLGGGVALGLGEDRKSTRLNSSHLVISYAVFCLKK